LEGKPSIIADGGASAPLQIDAEQGLSGLRRKYA